jgi:hypothetical protein
VVEGEGDDRTRGKVWGDTPAGKVSAHLLQVPGSAHGH